MVSANTPTVIEDITFGDRDGDIGVDVDTTLVTDTVQTGDEVYTNTHRPPTIGDDDDVVVSIDYDGSSDGSSTPVVHVVSFGLH